MVSNNRGRERRSSSTVAAAGTEEACPQCCQAERASSSSSRSARSSRSHGRRRERRRRHASSRHRSRNSRSRSNRNHQQSSSLTQGRSMTATTTLLSPEEEAKRCQVGQWPHGFSFVLAALSCTIGFFNISRFAILTLDFGAVFVVQFLLLSLCFGIPLMAFHVSIGQYLGSGVVDMWRISPIFQGIGISLMLSQGMLGTNGITSISWLFVYFRDSSITVFDRYRWSHCLRDVNYRRACEADFQNNTWRLEESLPDYFSATVLQRSSPTYPNATLGHLKFQTVFNMAVIWMVIFIGLSKGLKSYGKVVYLFGILPIVGFLVFAIKVLGLIPFEYYKVWYTSDLWEDFFYNEKSWVCAARECFFTWSLLGASLMQLSSHNKFRHQLARDTSIIIIITLGVLVVSGLVGFATVHVLTQGGYNYEVSSFETYKSYEFLSLRRRDFSNSHQYGGVGDENGGGSTSALKSILPRYKEHVSFVSGIRIIQPGRDLDRYSGYQVMRLATELVPAFASVLGPKIFSPFWVVLFYFSMILFGLGQQMALWHTVVSGIVAIKPETLKKWETCITFSCCVFGFILGLPMATEIGEFVLYFLDYTIGCGWWLMSLYLLQLFAIFVVRGKPYSSEKVAGAIIRKKSFFSSWTTPLFAFSWNVVLPLGLLILTILSFKTGRFAEMFDWSNGSGYLYLPSWVREIGAMMQLMPLLLVPFVAVIQSCRYFIHGPLDLFDRIDLLYRPGYASSRNNARGFHRRQEVILTNYSNGLNNGLSSGSALIIDDPPPKYTPPPSYSTATGARIARFLRQSFRQSVRRLRGEGGANTQGAQALVDRQKEEEDQQQQAPPPDYATVVIETARHSNPPGGSSSDPVYFSSTSTEYGSIDTYLPPQLHTRQNSATNTILMASELNLMFQDSSVLSGSSSNSSGRPSVARSLSFSYPSFDGAPIVGVHQSFDLQRVDSQAVLIQSAEPIDRRLPPGDDTDTNTNDDKTYSAGSMLSLGETIIFLDNDLNDKGRRPNCLEAMSLNITIPLIPSSPTTTAATMNPNSPSSNLSTETLSLQMDTSTSVI